MNRKLKEELKTAFDAPLPTRKTKFLNSLSYPKATAFEFYLSQAGYIRKRFWVLSILVVAIMIFVAGQFQAGYESVSFLSAVLPLFTLIGITEVSRSTSYHMNELEMSCKFNLGKITLLRLSVISSFHFLGLMISLLIFSNNTQYGFLRYALYSITPFLLCSYLSFWVVNHLKTRDALYACSGVTIFISVCFFMLNEVFKLIYSETYIAFWSAAFLIIVILLIREMKKMMKQTEELRWNFVLTD